MIFHKKLFMLILIGTFFSNCSNLSKNFVRESKISLSSGKAKNSEWEDDLVFKRYSWYKELTLVYDLLVVKIHDNSPYIQWLSNSEKEMMAKCQDHFIAITYAQDSTRIAEKDMVDQFGRQMWERFAMAEFKRNLQMHPDYETLSLKLYNVDGYCRKQGIPNPLTLNFPGFKSRVISSN